jgi:molybdate transport system regulatory protein
MKLSTRNQLKGTISSITEGGINSEVTLSLAGGTEIVSVITNGAVKNLELKVGNSAYALIKASNVMIGIDVKKISARNVLVGKISSIIDGNVNDEISVDLGGGYVITSIITKKSAEILELAVGKEVSAIVKSSSVILAVD